MANALEEITIRNWQRAVPMSTLLEITFVCNHACSFCYNCPTGQKEMSTAEIFDALQKLADFNILYLTLSGGEPRSPSPQTFASPPMTSRSGSIR